VYLVSGDKNILNRFLMKEIYFAISGKPALSKHNNLQFTHPDFDKITEEESYNFLNTGKIIPFYRIPKELKITNVGDLSLRKNY